MPKLLALALALGFDSFLVSIALGTLGIGRSTRRNLILLFALCDGFASLAGGVLSVHFVGIGSFWFGKLQAVALCLYLLVVMVFANCARIVRLHRPSATVFYAVPLLLCFDNLATGLSFGQPVVPFSVFATIVGLVSALMALLGLQVGSLASRHLPTSMATFAGVALLALVAVMPLR